MITVLCQCQRNLVYLRAIKEGTKSRPSGKEGLFLGYFQHRAIPFNLGIGTTSPGYQLEVVDDTASWMARFHNDGNATTRNGLIIACGTDDNTGTNNHIEWGDGDGTQVGLITSSGGTVTYGAFTANHDVSVPEEFNEQGYPYGTLMCIESVSTDKAAPRKILYKVKACNHGPYCKRVLGVYAGKYPDKENLHQVYVLGDGHILVNGQGGNIAIGDPITTSSTEGIGMKATRAGMVVGYAQEDYQFRDSTDNKLIVVQYGLDYYIPIDEVKLMAKKIGDGSIFP